VSVTRKIKTHLKSQRGWSRIRTLKKLGALKDQSDGDEAKIAKLDKKI